MQLIKKEHRFSQNEIVYDVVDLDEIIEIAENIDTTEVQRELFEMAFDNLNRCDYTGSVVAELSLITGDIIYYYSDDETETLAPDLYIVIGSTSTDPQEFEWEYENVLDGDYIDEFNELIEDEYGEFFDDEESAFEHILEKYDIDEDELIKNYFMNDADDIEISSSSEIIEEIKRIYDEESMVVEEN